MRVCESGFRDAAKRGKVPLKENGKPLPVEFATWQKIIDGLNAVSKGLKQSAKSNRRESRSQFYADLASQCMYIRDIYRDQTMHARKRYSHQEAVAAFICVKQFITLLAGKAK